MSDCRVYPERTCISWERCKTKAACKHFGWSPEGRAAREARAAIRTFPMPEWPKEGRPENWCRWCGGEIAHGRAAQRSWHDGREDEPECKLYWGLYTDPRVQRPFIAERDGEKCFGCGGEPGRWQRNNWPTRVHGREDVRTFDPKDLRIEYVGEFWRVTWVSALELEHTVPLWSVSHLPAHERRPYFGPGNIRLLGPCCHKPKTAGEAKVRAKTKSQSKMRLDVPRETMPAKGHRKLQSRNSWPDKERAGKIPSRPLRGRNSFRR